MDTPSYRASLVLRALYGEYCRALDAGEDAPEFFGGLAAVQRLVPAAAPQKLIPALNELHSLGLLRCDYGDDQIEYVSITSAGVQRMRSRFRRLCLQLLSLLAKAHL